MKILTPAILVAMALGAAGGVLAQSTTARDVKQNERQGLPPTDPHQPLAGPIDNRTDPAERPGADDRQYRPAGQAEQVHAFCQTTKDGQRVCRPVRTQP